MSCDKIAPVSDAAAICNAFKRSFSELNRINSNRFDEFVFRFCSIFLMAIFFSDTTIVNRKKSLLNRLDAIHDLHSG